MADNPWEVKLPSTAREMGDWPERSACREACRNGDADPSWWFPPHPKDVAAPWRRVINAQTASARAICGGCPVQQECLSWALEHREHGIWGGLNLKTRQSMPKPRTCAECGTRFVRPAKPGGSSLGVTCSDECRKARLYRQKRAPELAARHRESMAARRKAQAS